ncbi:tripartite tricarboxylate transporter substrate binding protein [Roseomonas sp. NAR14]|uniref:Tripartite tricarboxylate transporter substrate binding protein n=1 Tax=Roseomonas acroporae TaxID=2937791 RepID=A0A9X1Y9P4_9PROT|nr:tripartite tricarboxylate transporter substrate binding protein [Roseomonas acroporae]MCK8786096.1 tripartite tricarboxylate transporter substrate binding protein [Roseomonas acroporae]
MADRRALLLGGACLLAGAAARAQPGFPNRAITLIAPSAPGSQTDIFSRVLAEPLGRSLGRPVVVENRPGASGILGTLATVRAAPDGHTLVYNSNSGTAIAPQLRRPPPYVTPRDLTPVALTLSGPSVIVVGDAVEAATIEDFVATLRARPGRLNLGSHGVGSFSHVAMEMFMAETRTVLTHIPYNGGGPLGSALLAGDVQVALLDVMTARPLLAQGRGRVLAQVGERRSPLFPDVPLVSETVASSVNMDYWLGLFAPAATPPALVERLHAEVTAAMALPASRARVAEASMLPPAITLPALREKVAREWEEWGRVIRDRDIVVQ